MNQLGQIFEFLQKLVIWWVTIMPWEEAVHVRMGKKVTILKGGLHMRIPFVDRVYVQTTRTRIIPGNIQTITTMDGKCVTVLINMGYRIVDIEKLYTTLYHADATLLSMIQGIIADEVCHRPLIQCTPDQLEKAVQQEMKGELWGLEFEFIKIVGFAVVKTYRLIQDGHYLGGTLETDKYKA
jgi:regulator of protease activity HflC (stomatin/prohibitin superfamily)